MARVTGMTSEVSTSAAMLRARASGDADDAGDQRDLVLLEAVGVAGAVPAFVVVADDRNHGHQVHHVVEHGRALDGMRLHVLELAVGKLSGLAQHGIVDADLADVVERRAGADLIPLRGAELEVFGLINQAHASTAKQLHNTVVRDGGVDHSSRYYALPEMVGMAANSVKSPTPPHCPRHTELEFAKTLHLWRGP